MFLFCRARCQMFLSLQLSSPYSENSLDTDSPASYHPTSNFCFLGKVLEHVVVWQLQTPLDTTIFLNPCQSGFHLWYSMKMGLVTLVNDLHLEINRGNCTLLMLLDLSATFDTVDHEMFITHLWNRS